MIKINIDLTQIAQAKKHRKAKNEHNYIDLIVTEMKQPDEYGNDLTIYISKTKDESDSGEPTIYVGKGKTILKKSEPQQQQTQQVQQQTPPPEADLPF